MKNRGQISMEFAILMAIVVAAVAIVGFYYLKMTKRGAIISKGNVEHTESVVGTKALSEIKTVKKVVHQ